MKPPDQWTKEEYLALSEVEAAAVRRAWAGLPGTRATTPNGAPYPLRSWPPDAALDIQHLAEWTDLLARDIHAIIPLSPFATAPTDWQRVTQHGAVTVAGGITVSAGLVTVPVAGWYLVTLSVGWLDGPGDFGCAIGYTTSSATITGHQEFSATSSGQLTRPNITAPLARAAGETFTFWAYSSKANANRQGGHATVNYLGPKA